MTRKRIEHNARKPGRINVSSGELDLSIGSAIDVAESPAIARAIIDSKDPETFLVITSYQ
jgi:hypothetical protein